MFKYKILPIEIIQYILSFHPLFIYYNRKYVLTYHYNSEKWETKYINHNLYIETKLFYKWSTPFIDLCKKNRNLIHNLLISLESNTI